MWVQSASKKVSFCLIILARVAADTLSATTLVDVRISLSVASQGQVSGFRPCCRNYVTQPSSKRSRFADFYLNFASCAVGRFDFLGETAQEVHCIGTSLPKILFDSWKALHVARSVR